MVLWLVWCAIHGYHPRCTVFATPCVQGCCGTLVSVVCNTRLLPSVYSVLQPPVYRAVGTLVSVVCNTRFTTLCVKCFATPCVQGCCDTAVSVVCNTRSLPSVYSVLQPPVYRAVVVHWLVWCLTQLPLVYRAVGVSATLTVAARFERGYISCIGVHWAPAAL